MLIQVLGPGCPKCNEAEKVVRDAVSEAGIEATVAKVSDFQEIAKMGVFTTPAVAVDGQVKCIGKVPSRKDVLSWIRP